MAFGTSMRIGAHESIAGGLHLAFDRAQADGAEALQVFTKSSRQWDAKPISVEDATAFRAAGERTGISVICHDSYLINLGAESADIRRKSVAAFRDELERCETLGIPWLVAHPGANADEAAGLKLISDGITECLSATAGAAVGVLLEITAGQGTNLGYRFEHLRRLLEGVAQPDRTGVCLDTCHLYAAGYDIATEEGYAATMEELERLIGARHVRAMHLNDAKKGLNCRVDRHENIGAGTLGLQTFARIVRDERLKDVVAVLETPEGRWKKEIALLRSLRDASVSQSKDLRPRRTGTKSKRKTPKRVAKREPRRQTVRRSVARR